MSKVKLRQLEYESETWKRLLGFMVEENIYLKNRLSEVLHSNASKTSLDDLENFQNDFIKSDELMMLLRNDIAEFDGLLVREVFEDGRIIKLVEKKMKKLRQGMKDAEEHFARLKSSFNSYLSENI